MPYLYNGRNPGCLLSVQRPLLSPFRIINTTGIPPTPALLECASFLLLSVTAFILELSVLYSKIISLVNKKKSKKKRECADPWVQMG